MLPIVNIHHMRWMRHLRVVAALLLLSAWLLGWATASAQSWPPLQGVVADNTGNLDSSRVNSAADQLKALGVKPLAVLFNSAPGYSDPVDFAHAAAAHYNLTSGGSLNPDLFAIVVVLDTRKSVTLYGDRLKLAMEQSRVGGTLADQIRNNTLNPTLAGGDFTRAFVDSFTQAAAEIDLYKNPPATATPIAPVVNNTKVDTQGLGIALLIGLLIIIVLIVLVAHSHVELI